MNRAQRRQAARAGRTAPSQLRIQVWAWRDRGEIDLVVKTAPGEPLTLTLDADAAEKLLEQLTVAHREIHGEAGEPNVDARR